MFAGSFLTFDIEEWFDVNYACAVDPGCAPSNLDRLTDTLLRLCHEHRVRSTFFVLGKVAAERPNLVRRIHANGHEVASHGYAHTSLRSMSEHSFRQDTQRSVHLLEDITGAPVLGYRAPSLSVTRENAGWFYRVLSSLELKYSSSVFPGKTFLYGVPSFPPRPHRPRVDGEEMPVVEFPISRVGLFNLYVPLYLRLFPPAFLSQVIRRRSRMNESVMLYLHPREIDPDQPRLPLAAALSLVHYWGIRNCEGKLRRLLGDELPFCRVCDALHTVQ